MLNRLMGDRFWENLVNKLNIGLSVNTLAKAMIKDAETSLLDTAGESVGRKQCTEKEGTRFYTGNSSIEAYIQDESETCRD